MPEIKHYLVREVREVYVAANTIVGATQIADAAFKHGQNSDNGVAYEAAPVGIWGNTVSKITQIEITAKEDK